MTPNATPSKAVSPPHTGFPLGFLVGMLGGMAALYLTHSSEGQKLRAKLIDTYDQAKVLAKPLEADLTHEAGALAAVVTPVAQAEIVKAQSLLEKLRAKLAAFSTLPDNPLQPKNSAAKHFFTKKH